ncbi:PREDICTED: F-box/kelch-repeat protein SKIP6-like [Fragaria vesca subsp. vesca]|uniref:F-box/kelch-repeat protein SKIP6-like n=1 Tax=Fragaria vesca subsp. vesca TaxID=101020 RepID=UPI0002C2E585|nr:PREDICTED: F-box/kelch-repeat protein SKIP6-like [Fragaria vesca subsp. vesca]
MCNDKNNLLISYHYHPILSVLSKPIRSLLSSHFFFTTRSLLNSAQHLLYLSLRSSDHHSTWFALYQNPNPLNAAARLLVPIPPISIPSVRAAYAFVGSSIYVLDESVDDTLSNNVWILDYCFHTWRSGSSMLVACEFVAAGVVDGRVDMIGDCVTNSWTGRSVGPRLWIRVRVARRRWRVRWRFGGSG